MNHQDPDKLIDIAAARLIDREPPRALTAAVMASLAERGPVQRSWGLRPMAACVSGVIAVVVIWLAVQRGNEGVETVAVPPVLLFHHERHDALVLTPPVVSSLVAEPREGAATTRRAPPAGAAVVRSPVVGADTAMYSNVSSEPPAIEPLAIEPLVVAPIQLTGLEHDALSIEGLEIEALAIAPLSASND